MEKLFFGCAFAAAMVSTAMFIAYVVSRREELARVGKRALVIGVVFHIASLIVRTVAAKQMPGHEWYVPWSNWFESLSFFALVISVEYLLIQRRQEIPVLGAFVTPLAMIAMIGAVKSSAGMEIPAVVPALQSFWMIVHVPVMFFAYAAFANAFAIGIVYLLQERQLKSRKPTNLMFRLPALDDLDNMIYRTLQFALPLLMLGVFLGAQWAYNTWGRYWGWDPKETSALITILVYAFYFYMRIVVGWRGRKTAYLSLIGFFVTIGSYIGVNYLSPLHDFLQR